MPRQRKNSENEAIRRMIHHSLQRDALVAPSMIAGEHLDDDSLGAFIEGRLTATESAPLISHIVACAFCRHATAQLIRLESELGEFDAVQAPMSPEPSRIRRLLEALAARVLPQTDEEAVFAYQAPTDDSKSKDTAGATSDAEAASPSAEEAGGSEKQTE